MNERGGLLVSEPVDDDYCDQVVDMRSKRIVWQYRQTDLPGRGLDSLRTPKGWTTFRSTPRIDHSGPVDLHNFRNREWKPAQRAAGIEPLRRLYDLRHTFATFALRAGISTFDLFRCMGASLTMIDRHYGHLARDGREHAIRLLDELGAGQRPPWTLVDAAWTPDSTTDSAKTTDHRLSRGKLEAL
jgi:hypothetical protein